MKLFLTLRRPNHAFASLKTHPVFRFVFLFFNQGYVLAMTLLLFLITSVTTPDETDYSQELNKPIPVTTAHFSALDK